jgi:cytochrome b subunit of formate dehydrogenase
MFFGEILCHFFCQKGETIGTLSFLVQIRLIFGFFGGKKNSPDLGCHKENLGKKKKKNPIARLLYLVLVSISGLIIFRCYWLNLSRTITNDSYLLTNYAFASEEIFRVNPNFG